jgi:hypothetical protein
MSRYLPILAISLALAAPPTLRADAFDHYINPILAKVPSADGTRELKQLTPDLLAEHNRVLANLTGSLVVVQTNDGRWSKLLVQAGRRKTNDDPPQQIPILLVDRYTTYKEGQERAIQASGSNVYLFNGFHFSLDLGQVVPAALGGDIRFVAEDGKQYLEPLGKAKLYLLTKPIAEATPKKPAKLVVGEAFEIRYFNGTYKLHDDGRRSGTLNLKVDDAGEVTGSYYSDSDGQKYEVFGKVGTPRHTIQFTIRYPRTEQVFRGFLFTGNGKALTGTTRLQDRDTGFYAVRVEE